jgi:tape measure domain-containing protein
LGLDSAQFETGLKRSGKEVEQFGRRAKKIEQAASLISTSLRGLAGALGLSSIAAAGNAYIQLADKSKQLSAQLKLATSSFGSFGQAQKDVNRIANETRNGLTETGTLYGNFMRATRELGGTQAEAARATETFSKTLKISGADQNEAASATLQFGQALASGVLRGDEFNSIMESSPRLARLLADSLNTPIGNLRKMAEEGELTADRLFRALTDKKFTGTIDAEFNQMPVTFGEAMEQVRNAATVTFGAFDQGGEFSQALSDFVGTGADGFANLAKAAEEMGISVRSTLAGLANAFDPLLEAGLSVFEQLGGGAFDLQQTIRSTLKDADRLLNIGPSVANFFGAGGKYDSHLLKDYDARQQQEQRRLSGQADQRRFDAMTSGYDILGNRKGEGYKPAAASSGSKKKGSGPSEETLRKRAQKEAERAADALRRFTDDLAREQSDLATALADLSGTVEARRDADLKQIEVERQVRERSINDNDQIDAAKKQQLINLNDENAAARKRLAQQRAQEEINQRTIQRERDRADLAVELLQLSAAAARTAQDRRAVELRILDAQFDVERRTLEIEAASTDMETALRARARLLALPQLQAGATSQAMRQTQGPLESYLDQLPKSAAEAREALEQVQVNGLDGLINGLADAASGARSLGDVFKQVTQQIIADLIRIQLQKAIVGGLSSVLGGVFGGGNPLAGSLSTASANVSSLASGISARNLTGFATGGSFKVGGSSSVGDQQLVQFRANRGEIVDIRKPGNDNGGGRVLSFDLRGAVMTADLLAQMNAMADGAAVRGAMGGSALAQDGIAQRGRRRIPGR